MSPQAKREYFMMMYARYHKTKKRKEKSEIISEFCKSYQCHRKHALRLLNGPAPSKDIPARKKRKPLYSPRLLSMIESIWEASGHLWSLRLKSVIHLWLPWIRKRFVLTPQEEKQLLNISASQIDRRLKNKKQWLKKKVYGSTKAGAILKHQIPIQTEAWNVRVPGYIEADLVSHCGGNASGSFAHTLTWTDIQSQWVERRAILGRGQFDVLEACKSIQAALPFPLRGLDCDNDGSFINFHLFNYCKKQKVQFTRSRPYKKNDNAHVEQKNWTHVREILGYHRYDSQLAMDAINALYTNELRFFQNFFQPSVKLIKKIRIGSKVKKKYDKPQTPYQRLFKRFKANKKYIKQLELLTHFKTIAEQWNPFELSHQIETKLSHIYTLASKTPKKAIPVQSSHQWLLPTPNTRQSAFGAIHFPSSVVQQYRKIYKKEKFLKTW